MGKYKEEIAQYIYDCEAEDFFDWLESDGETVISRESLLALKKYHEGAESCKVTAEVIRAYSEAAKYHIYACAWMVFIAGKD